MEKKFSNANNKQNRYKCTVVFTEESSPWPTSTQNAGEGNVFVCAANVGPQRLKSPSNPEKPLSMKMCRNDFFSSCQKKKKKHANKTKRFAWKKGGDPATRTTASRRACVRNGKTAGWILAPGSVVFGSSTKNREIYGKQANTTKKRYIKQTTPASCTLWILECEVGGKG